MPSRLMSTKSMLYAVMQRSSNVWSHHLLPILWKLYLGTRIKMKFFIRTKITVRFSQKWKFSNRKFVDFEFEHLMHADFPFEFTPKSCKQKSLPTTCIPVTVGTLRWKEIILSVSYTQNMNKSTTELDIDVFASLFRFDFAPTSIFLRCSCFSTLRCWLP